MRWSKVRKLVHKIFADSVRGRVRIDVTNADPRKTSWSDTCKFGIITVDGHVVAHVDPHSLRKLTLSLPNLEFAGAKPQLSLIVMTRPEQSIPDGASFGEFLDFPDACWRYLNSSLDESLREKDPFVSSLAVLNSKVGKQRLRRMLAWDLHPLTKWMVHWRLAEETKRSPAREHASAID